MSDADETNSVLPISAERWAAIVARLKLSPQQTRIAEFILQCWSDDEIADAMKISKATIRVYVGRIFERVGVRSRQALIIRIWELSEEIAESCHHCQ